MHTDLSTCVPSPTLMSVLQACQFVKSEDTNYPLRKADVNTTWEIVTPSPADSFEFRITYMHGEEGR